METSELGRMNRKIAALTGALARAAATRAVLTGSMGDKILGRVIWADERENHALFGLE
jgi:hypothetical protein